MPHTLSEEQEGKLVGPLRSWPRGAPEQFEAWVKQMVERAAPAAKESLERVLRQQHAHLTPERLGRLDDWLADDWAKHLAFWEHWFEHIGLGPAAVSDPADPHGFYDKATGEPMCPFRAVPCMGRKCSWWEALVKAPDAGHGYKYECWFWLRKYEQGATSGLYSDCPDNPAEVIAMLRREGYGPLPCLAS